MMVLSWGSSPIVSPLSVVDGAVQRIVVLFLLESFTKLIVSFLKLLASLDFVALAVIVLEDM